jgi:cytochrome c553
MLRQQRETRERGQAQRLEVERTAAADRARLAAYYAQQRTTNGKT